MSASHKVEKALRDTQHILNRLLAVSPAVIYSTTPHPPYHVQYMSDNVATVTGYSPDQYTEDANFWMDRVHPDDLETVRETLKEMQERDFIEMEYRMLCADDRYHYLHEEIKVLRDATGKPVEGIGYFVDITEQKQYEEAIRQQEELYRSLAEASRDLIFLISKKRKVDYLNSYARRALGITSERANNPSYEMVSQLIPEKQICLVFNSRQAVYIENQAVIQNNKVWLGTWLVPIVSSENDPDFVMAVARDITRQRETEEELNRALQAEQELNTLRYRFLTMATHEFKTPLSTILSSIELLEHYGDRWGKEKQIEHRKRIKSAAQKLDQMISEVLEVNRIEAQTASEDPAHADLLQISENIINEVQQSNPRTRSIIFQHRLENPDARIDRRDFRNILINLLSNAVKYSRPERDILIELEATRQQVLLRVRDHGIGVPVKDREKLFEPFYRGENAESVPGTGLGLAIVKRSVDSLGGEIWYEEGAGGGSVFTVRIPLADREK
ncbi:MAG: ATP-binding protein [Chloroflexota bacterium]|jgi:PAS domain S-box-containing protein